MVRIYSGDALLALRVENEKFNKQLEKNFLTIQGSVKPKLMKIAIIYLRNVMLRTPVDTGHAKAGWHIDPAKTTDYSITVANRVEYIIYLEAGHSKQAPNGMARLALIEIGEKLKDGSLKL